MCHVCVNKELTLQCKCKQCNNERRVGKPWYAATTRATRPNFMPNFMIQLVGDTLTGGCLNFAEVNIIA